ncbi:unnamed protein product [Peronospora belbahrii]|uniref:CG-1 domain-containing protein n=1 Tax=Peronospora belbahrii TaxID=622444 RepID=A0AAU9KRM3_9STRA|nr:unnamed protein product [Peronospora belbahrii]
MNNIQVRATSLRKEATRRWLVKEELYFLLLHYKLVSVPAVLHSLQLQPPSGTLLFYNTLSVLDYKKDGWHWQKRKDKSGRVREDRAKLVINREIIILGTYVHSAETSTFHRRIYSVRDSNENIILVHYFDEVNKEGMGRQFLSDRNKLSKGLQQSFPLCQQPNLPTCTSTSSEEAAECIMKGFEPQSRLRQTSSIQASDAELLLLKCNGMENVTTESGIYDLLNSLNWAPSPEKSIDGMGGQQTFELTEIVDFSPDWDFENGGAKILICLAAKFPASLVHDPTNVYVQFGTKRVRAEKVSDTVLRCSAPSAQDLGCVDLYVCHWNETFQPQTIQLSHKRKFTYRSYLQVSPSRVGDIATKRHISDSSATDPQEGTTPYSVHVFGTSKRGRSLAVQSHAIAGSKRSEDKAFDSNRNLSTYVESDLDERQCKIRVVERLSEFNQAICTKSLEPVVDGGISNALKSTGGESNILAKGNDSLFVPDLLSSLGSSTTQEQQVLSLPSLPIEPSATLVSSSETLTSLDDCTIEALSDKELEQLSEKLLERVVRQLVTVAYTSEELLEELNSLDEAGLSLLHYVSFYNYSQLVPVLVAHGAHINQQSTQGQTALHLAAGCGHDEVVDVLQQSGVDLQVRDFDGLTAADRAEKSGHANVAAKLRRYMGYDTFCDLGEVDGTHEFGGSPMDIDDAPTPYMDAGDMGILESNDHTVHGVRPSCSLLDDFESPCEASLPLKAISYEGDNQEHNRKLLLGAFSTMSLHDKCALSLSISRDSAIYPAWRHGSSVGEDTIAS